MPRSTAVWDEYRRRHRIAAFGLLGLPAVVGVAILAKLYVGVDSELLFATLASIWCCIWGWAAFRVARWPCPRCGAAYLANQDPWQRRCAKCGLQLYADPNYPLERTRS